MDLRELLAVGEVDVSIERGLKPRISDGVSPEAVALQEMVETVLTPPHPDPFEALLDEPFAGTLYHPAAQRQPQLFVLGIVDMLAMPLQVGIHGAQRVPCCRRQPLHVQGIRQVCQDPIRLAMP